MKRSADLFSPFRTTITLLTAFVFIVGIAACSNVTDFSSDEIPTVPEEALGGEVIPAPEAPVKPDVIIPPVKPVLQAPPPKPHLKVASGNIELKGEGTPGYSGHDAKPLFIVEGKKYTDFELSEIEPNQIESIEVLKGAAAKAIYGVQAKDGAVIVTKKDEDRE